MRHLHHRVVVDDRHLGVMHLVHHLVHLDLNFYMDHYLLVHQLMNLYAVDNFHHLLADAHLQDVQQNLDEQNLGAHLTFLDADHFRAHLRDVAVDAELHSQLKMDYFQDVVDAELQRHLKMDYFLDVELVLQESQKLAHLVLALQVVVFVALQFVQGVLLFLLALL
jgi:hypothetical protein